MALNTYVCSVYRDMSWTRNIKVKAKGIDNLRKNLISKYNGKGEYFVEVYSENGKILGTLDLAGWEVVWLLGTLGDIANGTPVGRKVNTKTGALIRGS